MRAAPAACGDSTTSCSSSDVGATSCASSDASAASTSALGDSALQLLLEQQAAVARETAACRLRLEQQSKWRPGESLAGLLDPAAAAAAAPAAAAVAEPVHAAPSAFAAPSAGRKRSCSSTISSIPEEAEGDASFSSRDGDGAHAGPNAAAYHIAAASVGEQA